MNSADLVWVGGLPAHYMRAFHRRLQERYGERIRFLYLSSSNKSDRDYERGGLPAHSHVLGAANSPGTILRLIGTLRKFNAKRILVPGHYPRGLIAAAMWGIATNKRVYYWSDTNVLDVLRKSPLRRFVRRTWLRPYLGKMTGLVYMGSRNGQFYEWVFGRPVCHSRLLWMPCPHDDRPFTDQGWPDDDHESYDGKPFRILYLGRLAPEKGVDRLIDSMTLLSPEAREGSRLTIAGGGPCSDGLLKLVKRRRLENEVTFLGPVQSEGVPEIMRGCDVLVLPSNAEAWGLTVNEGLSAGKPVIAPHWIGAAGDILIDDVTGVVTQTNSPADLAKALEGVFADRERGVRLGTHGRELVKSGGWNLDGAMNAFERLLED